jgi:tetratricopeptide (TPR) repeat protein
VSAGFTDEKAREAARVELQRAQVVMDKAPGEALEHLAEGRRLDPKNLEIAASLARIEVRLARYSDAIDSLQRVLVLDEASNEALGLQALCHFRLRHLEQAEVRARAALALNAANRIAREVLADCLGMRGAWQPAVDEFKGLLADAGLSDGAKARLNLKLAQCLLRVGAHPQAWEITHSLLRNGYADEQVKAVHRESEALNKAEIRAAFGKTSFLQRFVLWVADRHILRAVSLGRRRGLVAPGKSGTGPSDAAKGESA